RIITAGNPFFGLTEVGIGDEPNAAAQAIKVYVCRSDVSGAIDGRWQGTKVWGVSNYAANALVFGVPGMTTPPAAFAGAPRLPGPVPDGLSNPLFFTEKFAVCNRSDPISEAGGGGSLWAYPPAFQTRSVNYAAAVGFRALWPGPPPGVYLEL